VGRPGPALTVTQDLEIVARPQAGTPLLVDYLDGDGLARKFYFGHPHDSAAYRAKAAEVAGRFDRARRASAVALLRPVSPGAAAKLNEVVERDGFFVTTGQQAGLFGGPLLTIYKALTAVRLASRLETVLERPVAPVFWVASEDHDWDEVRRTSVLDRAGGIATVSLDGAHEPAPVSMARRQLGAEVIPGIQRLADALPDTEYAAELLALVRAAYRPERSVADAFTDLLAGLLADFPISIVQASDAGLKALSVPLLRAGLAEAGVHGEAVAAQSKRLAAAGYAVTVPVVAGASNLHYEDAEGRERLLRSGAGWQVRRTKRRFTEASLLERLEAEPGAFSPNVLLRPVVESAVLPTLCYVGGPAETSYFAQVGCLFRACGLEPPMVLPRAGFTLIDARVRRIMERLGLEPADAARPLEELRARVVSESLPAGVRERLGGLRDALGEGWGRLALAARAVDPTLDGPLRAMLLRSLDEVLAAERKIEAHQAMRSATMMAQLERVSDAVAPGGVPQERTVNVLSFLARFGPGLLQAVHGAIEIPLGAMEDGWQGPECGE
jgi:bacillithiol synthase